MAHPIRLAIHDVVPDAERGHETERNREILNEDCDRGESACNVRGRCYEEYGREHRPPHESRPCVVDQHHHLPALPCARGGGGGASMTRTHPRSPSTKTVAPAGIRRVASRTPTIVGMPNSRAMIAPCDSIPPR